MDATLAGEAIKLDYQHMVLRHFEDGRRNRAVADQLARRIANRRKSGICFWFDGRGSI
jgi:hypothetical protein